MSYSFIFFMYGQTVLKNALVYIYLIIYEYDRSIVNTSIITALNN